LGLCGLSLFDVLLSVGGVVDSVLKGSNLGIEVSDVSVVLVHVLVEEGEVCLECSLSVVFSLSLEVESLVELVLEIIDEVNDSADEFLVGLLVGSGGEGGEELDSLSIRLDVGHVLHLVGAFLKVAGDLDHNLGGEVGGVVGVGLEE
jgi:hypothetical protein